MKDEQSMLIAISMAAAAWFFLFRRANALNLDQSAVLSPMASRYVDMVPTPANVISNNSTSLAEKVAVYGNTGKALGDWSYE